MKNKNNLFFIMKTIFCIDKFYFLIGILIAFLLSIEKFIIPVGTKYIIDLSSQNHQELVNIILTLVLTYFIINVLNTWFAKYYSRLFFLKISSRFNRINFNKIRELDIKNYDDLEFKDNCLWVTMEAEGRIILLSSTFFNCILAITISILSLYFLHFDLLLILICVIASVALVIIEIVSGYFDFLFNNQTIDSIRYVEYFKRVYSLPEYAKENRLYSSWTLIEKDFIRQIEFIKNINFKYGKKKTVASIFSSLIIPLTLILSIIRIIYLIDLGIFAISDFVLVVNSVSLFQNSIQKFLHLLPQFHQAKLAFVRVDQFLKTKPALLKHANPIESDKEKFNFKLKNINFSYRNKQVINNLSLDIKNGQHLLIVGPNGAGKSTILKLLLRFDDPSSGTIELNEIDLKKYCLNSLKESISFLHQESRLYAVSIFENLYGDKEVFSNLNSQFDLDDLSKKYDFNQILTKEFSENGLVLSKGEQQKILIAKSLLSNKNLLIFDEPTRGLDYLQKEYISNKIIQFCQNKTLIMVSHDLSIAQKMDRIIFVENGNIVEDGNHKQLIKLNGRYAKFYQHFLKVENRYENDC